MLRYAFRLMRQLGITVKAIRIAFIVWMAILLHWSYLYIESAGKEDAAGKPAVLFGLASLVAVLALYYVGFTKRGAEHWRNDDDAQSKKSHATVRLIKAFFLTGVAVSMVWVIVDPLVFYTTGFDLMAEDAFFWAYYLVFAASLPFVYRQLKTRHREDV